MEKWNKLGRNLRIWMTVAASVVTLAYYLVCLVKTLGG